MINKVESSLLILGIFLFFTNAFALQPPALEHINSDYETIEFEYFGHQIRIDEKREVNQIFDRVDFESGKHSLEIGGPDLPVIREFIEIPFGADPVIYIENASYREIVIDNPVYPVQPPRVKLPDAKHPFVYKSEFYEIDDWYYQKDAKILETAISRDSRLALIEIHPVNYLPRENLLRIMTRGTIIIELPGASEQQTIEIKERYSTNYSRSLNEAIVLNPGLYRPMYWPPVDIGMLIISANGAGDTLQKYAHWKSRKGFKVEVHEYSDIGSSASDIQDFIQNEYDYADVPPQFIIFVGDDDLLPTNSADHSSDTPTDNHYVTVSGSDLIPDIFYGRWSLTSLSEIDEFMNRNIEYEKFDYSTSAWTNNICLPSTDDASWHELAEATQAYVANTHFIPMGYSEVDLIQAYYDGAIPSGDAVVAAIEDGRMIVNYTGHGATTYFDAPRVTQDDIRSMTNTDMYPFVIGNACVTGKFDIDECFAETWIRQEGKGAIAYMGASNNTMWDEDDAFERRMYDSTFVRDYYFMGGMMLKGLMAVYDEYSYRADYYFEIYHLFGDPSVALWFQPPSMLSVTHPETQAPGGGMVDVDVSSAGALENALVCITNDDDIHEAAYTNASGTASISLPAGMATGDTLWVTVTAYNKIPYEGFIIVSGNGPFLAYSSNEIDDDASGATNGDNDDMADSDERIGITVFLNNSGTLPAYSVDAILTESSPYANVITGNASYGNIAVGSTVPNSTQYIVDIADNVPDGTNIQFTLTATDSHDSTWTVNFSITAHAPILAVGSHNISGGDGDGFAEPGETVDLSIAGENSSVERAISVNGTLSESDPYVSLSRSTGSYGDIAPGGSSYSSVPYQVSISSSCPTPHYATIDVTLDESRGYSETGSIVFMVGNAGFSDDVEAPITGYSTTGTFRSTRRSTSGDYSWYFGRSDVFFHRDTFNYELITPSIIAPSDADLVFSHYLASEEDYDYAYIDITTDDGSSWTDIVTYHGQAEYWMLEQFDISSHVSAGDNFKVRFRFEADGGVHNEGWFIDDILVASRQNGYLGGGDVTPWAGKTDNDYTFYVNYLSPSSTAPSQARVYIDGSQHNMSLADGNYTDGARYEYTTTMPSGGHSYYFEFIAGGETIRFPNAGSITGPSVNASAYIAFDIGTSSSGFEHWADSYYDDWQWGTPSYGPTAASVPHGSNVWATKIAGEYSDSSQSHLTTPALDLTTIESPYLTYWHWYRFQPPNSYGYHDGGNIKISVDGGDPFIIFPQHGYDQNMSRYNQLNDYEFAYADDANGNFWQFECIDLSPWAGHSVTIYFDFGSSSVTTDAGWYINDIDILAAISAGMTEPTYTIPDNLEFSSFPNPFNAETRFSLELPNSGHLKIDVYDIDGRLVDNVETGYYDAGRHFFNWDAGELSNGVYFARCQAEKTSKTIKLLLVK
ncbi:MAG: C25 family cysteine peptidase [Candidatus Zixiibacteriota bacterium]